MTRIETKFAQLKAERRKAFIPYITAGDPSLDVTLELVFALEAAGADVIELGVPFSDPIEDGPVIQRATERALHNGVTLRKVLQLGENIRKKSEIPLVLFSYFNPLLNHGLERLRSHTTSPIAVGFGISRPEHVRAVWQEADAAIVGSSIVKEVEKHIGKSDLVESVAAFAGWLKGSQSK